MSGFGGGGNKCTICDKTAYPAETISFEKKPYHVECFRCAECNKKSSPGDTSGFEDKLYCHHCFQKNGFAQKQRNVKWEKKEGTGNALASKFGGGGSKCVVCTKTCYPAEMVTYEKRIFHQNCFKCTDCDKKISGASNAGLYEENLYCKKCFASNGYAQKQRQVKWVPKTSSGDAVASKFGGGGTKCTICEKTVYAAETVSFDKAPYHADCFKCTKCSKKTTPSDAAQFEGDIFCRKCFREGGYTKKQAASHGGGGGSAPVDARFAKFGGGGNKCPKCDKTVYPAETVSFEKKAFHPNCFTCLKCDKKLTPSAAEYHRETDEIHCKACHLELGLNRA